MNARFRELTTLPKAIGWRDHVIGAALLSAYVALLLATSHNLGFARDEGFYFHAASDYARWFRLLLEKPSSALTRASIDGIWSTNHEHPALMKSLFAFSWMFLYEKWHLFRDASTAFRFPGMLMGGLAVWVTYLFGARAFSRRAGFVAACLFALMPRVFYNAHLACFDVAIGAMWTLCVYVYWRSSERRGHLGWALALGVVYGLTLDTKHNAWILPAVLVPHMLVTTRKALGRGLRVGLLPLPLNLLAMATVGPLVFYALWPWIWHDTAARLQEYVNFHVHHDYYNMEFLGQNYFGPPSPRGYMPLMILATVPTTTLALFVVGVTHRLFDAGRQARAAALSALGRNAEGKPTWTLAERDLLLLLSLGAAVGPWLLPQTPIFGGTKHWLTAYPFLAIFAGHGMDLAMRALGEAPLRIPSAARGLVFAAVTLALLVPPAVITLHSHPFGLSSYVPLVGGAPGAADLGLNRQFWGFTTQSANAEYFEKNAPRNATVFFHDTAWDSWNRMVNEGRVRSDLRGVSTPTQSQLAIVHHELHMAEIDHHIWTAYGTTSPAHVVRHDGVPVVSIYRRP